MKHIKWNKKFNQLRRLENPRYRFYIYKGGRGGGKSHQIAIALLSIAQSAKKRILCTREIQGTIEHSVHKLLLDYITLYELHGFTVTANSIKHINGSEFIFKGLNDINDKSTQSLKSLEGVDIAWIEEAQTITKKSLDIFIPTIRKPNNVIIFSYNPMTVNDPVHQEFIVHRRDNAYIKHINYYDNPYLDNSQIIEAEHYKKHKPEDYDNIWLGKPRNLAANLVTKYFTQENINSNLRYVSKIPLHISCDFNTSAPMSWMIAHKDDDKIFFIDEIVMPNSSTADAMQEFLRRYPEHKGKIIINGDASGEYLSAGSRTTNYETMRFMLKAWGYSDVETKIRRSNPNITTRVAAWNNKIKTLQGERDILIHPKCKWLLYNIYNLSWKDGIEQINLPTSTQIKNNKELDYLGHIFDAASYMVEIYHPVLQYKLEK